MELLAILICLVLLVAGLGWLALGIYRLLQWLEQRAIRLAMDDIGRNLISETQHLSRHGEAVIALEIAGESLLKGRFVDGLQVAQKLKGGKG
jgi:hypothetical protein